MKEEVALKAGSAAESQVLGLSFAAGPYPMLVFDQQTHFILDVNDAALRQYGYSRQEFLAMTVLDIRPAEDGPHFRRLILDPRRRGQSTAGQWRHQTKNGTVFSVSITSWTLNFHGRQAELVLARPEAVKTNAFLN
jgi:two-component system, cell cycle sensor histidine kinase and response regulator CckA